MCNLLNSGSIAAHAAIKPFMQDFRRTYFSTGSSSIDSAAAALTTDLCRNGLARMLHAGLLSFGVTVLHPDLSPTFACDIQEPFLGGSGTGIASDSKSIKGARIAAQTKPIACRRHSPTCGRLGLRLQDTADATRLWAAPEREDACMLIPVAILAERCLCGAPLAQICQPMHHHAQSCYPTELPNCP